jgi:phosphoglycolate phosphatase
VLLCERNWLHREHRAFTEKHREKKYDDSKKFFNFAPTMIEKYKHIIWDWNGTLLNDVSLSVDLINNLLSQRRLPTLTIEAYKNIFQFPVKNYYAAAGIDFSKESFEVVGKEWIEEYDRRRFECKLHDDAEEVLKKISALGIGQSILSAYSQHTLEEVVAYHKLTKYFTHLYGLNTIYAPSKVDLGKKLMKTLGHSEGETLLIGDTEHDFDVANEIGADCVLIANGHQSREKLEKLGTKVFDDLKSLL